MPLLILISHRMTPLICHNFLILFLFHQPSWKKYHHRCQWMRKRQWLMVMVLVVVNEPVSKIRSVFESSVHVVPVW
ncbi:hypothetical protein FRACYDRAFT_273713, partial [Fragilariopsis cylindrus CCMP1102]